MNTLYQALTCTSNNQGIKNVNVYYDTLFTNIKTYNPILSSYNEYLLVDKLVFDYDTNSISSDNSNIISFGDTTRPEPYTTTGNGLVGTILLDDVKKVLVCGLSAGAINTYVPTVYEYNINTSSLHKLYPITDDWSSLVLGEYQINQTPLVSYNKNTHELNFLFKTSISASSAVFINSINDITFSYSNTLQLTNLRQLTSLSADNNFKDFKLLKSAVFDDGTKIILSNKNKSVQLFELA